MTTNVEFVCPVCEKLVTAPIKRTLEERLTQVIVACECPSCRKLIRVRINATEFLKN